MPNKINHAYSIFELAIVFIMASLFIIMVYSAKNIINKISYVSALAISSEVNTKIYNSNISLHLDAMNRESLNISMINGEEKVEEWKDVKKSGHIHAFLQSDSLIRPTYNKSAINNRPGVSFGLNESGNAISLNDSQIYGKDLFGEGNKLTSVIVSFPDFSENRTVFFNWYRVYGGYAHRVIQGVGTNLYHNFGNTCCYAHSVQDGIFPQKDMNKPAVVTMIKDGCSMIMRVNRVVVDSEWHCMGNNTSSSAYTSLGGGFSGSIGELIMFKERPSDEFLSSLEEILMRKWGIES